MPPVFAIAFLIVIYSMESTIFTSVWQLIGGIIFLGILPIPGYPLQKYIPYFKEKGREGQRGLAMIFSVIGYLIGTFTVFATKASSELCINYIMPLLMLLGSCGFMFGTSGCALISKTIGVF